MICPKCGAFPKHGKVSCCTPGGAWYGNCGTDDESAEHSWREGVQACKRKCKVNSFMRMLSRMRIQLCLTFSLLYFKFYPSDESCDSPGLEVTNSRLPTQSNSRRIYFSGDEPQPGPDPCPVLFCKSGFILVVLNSRIMCVCAPAPKLSTTSNRKCKVNSFRRMLSRTRS